MNKLEQLYEGKAKKVFATENPDVVIVSYKDDATAFDGTKKGTIVGKGSINNQMTNFLMAQLEKAGIPTHLVEELNEIICDNPGQTKLFFRLHDSRGKNHVLLRSQNRTVDVKRNLITYIEQTPALDYKIN